MKETIKLGKYLFIICAVAGVTLAGTNEFTTHKIASQKLKAENSALTEVLPVAFCFEVKDNFPKNGFDDKNNIVGYVLKVIAKGYSGQIESLVGLDRDFKITGVKILSQNETPGLGAKISEKNFLLQFIGKFSEKVLLKKDNKSGEIDGITSATISSRAITDAIRKNIDEFKKTVK
ncbi:MAG: RnfABCDGE type electron transport complex subunit G [Elusimicrobiota bacterium]|nr:RnfABCDGE type electron transport complex subunit G [Elusimicrobiota bacterium]